MIKEGYGGTRPIFKEGHPGVKIEGFGGIRVFKDIWLD